MSESRPPQGLDPALTRREIVMEADAEVLERMRKVGQARGFTVMCDEGPMVGGEDTAPPPLAYLCLSLGF